MDITERKITEITREAEKLEAKGYFVRRDAPTTGQSAAVPHGKGGEPEILQSGDRSGLLRISDEHTDQGGSRRFCRDAEQTLRGIQGGKPGRLFPLSVH